MAFRIVTWNINSVRLRLPLLLRLIDMLHPDMICLQELKAPQDAFPGEPLRERGYVYQLVNGQPGYNGVAILSLTPLRDPVIRVFGGREEARHISAAVQHGDSLLTIENFYVPAGGDIPDPALNDKFAHKLAFLADMQRWCDGGRKATLLVGDLNIAPLEQDVWSHRQLLDVVSHTPVEVEALSALQRLGGFSDALRLLVPPDEKLYSWWSYRARDWAASDRGRRLDHIWLSAELAPSLAGGKILREVRGWDGPSDHAPVYVDLA